MAATGRGMHDVTIHRRTGLHRDTISRAIHRDEPPVYCRAPAGSKLDPFKDEIHGLLKADPGIPGQNDFAIWQSLENHFWPLLYLADRDGQIRFHHFGEGNYEKTERAIQQHLGIDEETVNVEAGGLATAADWEILRGGETYIGYGRGAGRVDSPIQLALNHRALPGDWAVEEESAVLKAAGGSVTFRFHARDLNLVLAPPTSGAPVRFTVLLDGQPPGDDHGLDINELGEGTSTSPGCTSSSASVAAPSAPSRSPSPTRAYGRTSSPSADVASGWSSEASGPVPALSG